VGSVRKCPVNSSTSPVKAVGLGAHLMCQYMTAVFAPVTIRLWSLKS